MNPSSFDAPALETMNGLLPAYDFKALLAVDQFGAVYMAKQRSLDRDVAIKVLAPAVSPGADSYQAFETTARLMARLNHPNLIGVYDSGRVDGMLYFVMEFVSGKSLECSSKGNQVQVTQALNLISGICAGLSHAHDHGITHGDLNPANILLNSKAEPKIGNFGFTHPQQSAPDHGTSPYTAPEASHQHPTQSGDIFAVGAILYELLTGHPHREDAPAPSTLSKCGEAIDAVWKKATDLDPEMRFPDVKSVEAALVATLQPSQRPVTSTAAPGKKFKTAATPPASGGFAKAANASVNSASTGSTAASTPPRPAIKAGFNWKPVRNLVIIVALLYAISLAWEKHQQQTARNAREQLDAILKDRAEKEAKRLEELRLAEERRKKQAPPLPEVPSKPITPKPKTETPEESLARLKNTLYSGNREEMPLGSVPKGENSYFLVKEPMSWPEASWYAEQRGGHLAIPDTVADLTWLVANVASNEIGIWIGAARSGRTDWCLADGDPWIPRKPPAGTGHYLAFDKKGLLRAEGLTRKLPFVIQWRNNGDNPAKLESLLAKTKQSLAGNNPVYPPGTLAIVNRHYLYVARPILGSDALKLARVGGGDLAVPSDTSEISHIAQVTGEISAANGICIGGFRQAGTWSWGTGEPWKPATWIREPAPGDSPLVVIIRPNSGWDTLNSGDSASGFLIEWSGDARGKNPSGSGNAQPASAKAEFDALTKRARDLIIAANLKRDQQLASNAKTFTWDLDKWIKGPGRSENIGWAPHVTLLKATISNNRVPTAVPTSSGIKLSADMTRIAQTCAERQGLIDADFTKEADRVRIFYASKVREFLAQAVKSRQTEDAKAIEQTLSAASNTNNWLRSLGIEPNPTNPTPGSLGQSSALGTENKDTDENIPPARKNPIIE